MKKRLLSLCIVLVGVTALWAQNNVITYKAGNKLSDATCKWCSGFYAGDFNVDVISHTFSDSIGIITFSGDLTIIGDCAFSGFEDITFITIPNSVTSIGDYAFSTCTGLTFITIPDSMTSIGMSAFYHCSSLTSITIPNSVTSIESGAFEYCRGLTSIICKAVTPPTVENSAFKDVPKSIPLYVPTQSIADYKVTNGWKNFTNILPIEEHFENGHEYVDLGLSVKWATCNVGATKAEEYGDHFAWGETSPKTDYSWNTYKYCNGSATTMTKYCDNSNYGKVDNKTTLEAEDDAAHVNWGGNWRMPTLAELTELLNNCTITWTDNYQGTGVAGRIFTSKKTGYTNKSIFLPAAGYPYNSSLYDVGSKGIYWSSTLTEYFSYSVPRLGFSSINASTDVCDSRYQGFSVRPVCQLSSPFNPDDPFNPGIYTLDVIVNPEQGGTVEGTGEYAQGEEAELTATANTGYHFVHWNDGITTATRTITIAAHDTTLTANFELNKYLVSFLNYNGDTLQSDSLTYGSTPAYTGATPQKPAVTRWSYSFKEWNPAIVSVTQNAVYTAVFDSTRLWSDTVVVTDNQKVSDLPIGDPTYIYVGEQGVLDIDEPTTANTLTFAVNNPTSAQIIGIENLTIQDVTMVLRLDPQKENVTLGQWYAFAVPFEVAISTGIRKEGASSAAVSGYDFVIDYYDGALRASTQDGWKRCNSSDILQPGKFYMMAVNGTQNKWTFTKHVVGTLSELSSIEAQAHASTKAHHSGWNGLSNTLWQNASVELETSQVTLATRYNNAERVYEVVPISTTIMETATPFFVQVEQASNVLFAPTETPQAQGAVARRTNAASISAAATSAADASAATPASKVSMARVASTNGAQPYYPLTLTSATADGYVATSYLALSKTKANAYVIGRDVQKMTGAGKSVPQISIKMYQTDLSAHEASIATGSATIPLGLYAPKAGEYTLTLSEDLQGYDITLYNRAQVVFPDKMNTWTLSLTKGNTTAYQLVIKERKLPTDIENPESPQDATDTNTTQKIIRDNQLLILREGKMYNAQGGAVK